LAPKCNKKAKGSKLKTSSTSRPKVQSDEDEESEEDDLTLPDSDAKGEGYKMKSFRGQDLNDPTFSVGLMFANVQKLREALTEYSV
jgi:hypothetical protein